MSLKFKTVFAAIPIMLIGLMFHACKKDNKDSLSGDIVLAGRLYIDDYLYGQKGLPKGKTAEVFLFPTVGDGVGYLYSKKADSNGYFLLDFLKEQHYRISVQVQGDSVVYSADTLIDVKQLAKHRGFNIAELVHHIRDSITIALRPNLQGYTFYKVYTGLEGNEEGLSGVQVCLYSSAVQAQPGACNNAAYSFISGPGGKVLLRNVPEGNFYVRASLQIDSTLTLYYAGETTIDKNQLNIDTFLLKP